MVYYTSCAPLRKKARRQRTADGCGGAMWK